MTTLMNLVSVDGDFNVTRMHVDNSRFVILSGGQKLKTISWNMVARIEQISYPTRTKMRIHTWSFCKTDLQFHSLNDMWWFNSFADRQVLSNQAPISRSSDQSSGSQQQARINQVEIECAQQNVRPSHNLAITKHKSSIPRMHLDRPEIICKSNCDQDGLQEFNEWYKLVKQTPWTAIESYRYDDDSKEITLVLYSGLQRKVLFVNDKERENFCSKFGYFKFAVGIA